MLVTTWNEFSDVVPLPIPDENHAIGRTGQELRDVEQDLQIDLRPSIFWKNLTLQRDTRISLRAMKRLRDNWDSYGAPSPNAVAISHAERVLKLLEANDLFPTRVLPSTEGGIGFCFVQGNRYADIECTNDGEILGVRYVGSEFPLLIEMGSANELIERGIEQIRDHIRE